MSEDLGQACGSFQGNTVIPAGGGGSTGGGGDPKGGGGGGEGEGERAGGVGEVPGGGEGEASGGGGLLESRAAERLDFSRSAFDIIKKAENAQKLASYWSNYALHARADRSAFSLMSLKAAGIKLRCQTWMNSFRLRGKRVCNRDSLLSV